jgi:hypothetical protein
LTAPAVASAVGAGVLASTAGSAEAPATATATADPATAEVSDAAGAVKCAVGAGAVVFGDAAFLPMALAWPRDVQAAAAQMLRCSGDPRINQQGKPAN